MSKYRHISGMLFNTPWAIMEEKLAAMVEVLDLRLSGQTFTPEQIAAVSPPARTAQKRGDVAVLPLFGVMAHRANIITQASGGTSTEMFGKAFRAAVEDPGIKAVVIDIDSPGGEVRGVEELARDVFAARSAKPIVAVANSLAGSAAYWVGTQASELVAIPSALVGSIGVIAQHRDTSMADETAGVKTTIMTAGKFKGEGNPHEPLTAEGAEHMQSLLNDYYDMFTSAVAKGRGVSVQTVKNGYGEGRVLTAKRALAEGMVDRIATMDQVLSRHSTGNGGSGVRADRLARMNEIALLQGGINQ